MTWTITDLCETFNPTATFTVNPPVEIAFNAPDPTEVDACDYADQTALQAAFDAWVTAQTAALGITGGCDPQVSDNSDAQTLQALCDGGAVTVTWTITDLCETFNPTATFTVNPPVEIAFNAPDPTEVDACDYADQTALQAAFDAWVTAQTAALGITGGCDPQVSDNSDAQTLQALCDGGAVTVTWTITDLCETFNPTATFTVNPPVEIAFNAPDPTEVDACDYADQTALQAAFDAWVTAQTAALGITGGCDPQVSDNSDAQTLQALCDGGAVTVTWTITDLCETFNPTATFTVNPPVEIAFNAPDPTEVDACDYADQTALQAAFDAWVTAQTAALGITGGCDPQVSDNSDAQTLQALCDGGAVTVTWTITDLCETFNPTATFTVNPPVEIAFNAPDPTEVDACDYADQTALQAAFDAWVTAQTAALGITGGCDPQVSDNSDAQTLQALCDGGAVTVTWTITDLCETFNPTATFTVNPPVEIAFNAPDPTEVDACDYADQTALQAAFDAWVTAQTAALA